MNKKTGHPALDQRIPIFMEVYLSREGVRISVYDLTLKGLPVGLWIISWKGIARLLWSHIHNQFTVFAGMSVDDLQAYAETGDRPLGYDG